MTDAAAGTRRLLIRDLEQVATPSGAEAPLRGQDLGAVDVLERAYVLCASGRIESIGEMSSLTTPDGEVEELDGRGLCAIPGLVDCHTHACFAGDRVEEFSLRATGATYEVSAGDVIVQPKGWSGRWDVKETIRKVWSLR